MLRLSQVCLSSGAEDNALPRPALPLEPGTARGKMPMSAKVTSFLTDWLDRHVVGRIASAEDIRMLTSRCLDDAAQEGISGTDIERVVGPVEGCIRLSLRQGRK